MLTLQIREKPNLSQQNYSSELITPNYIVIHCIGYEESKALNILTGSDSKASSHYFIPQYELSTAETTAETIEYPIYRITTTMEESSDQVVKIYHAGASEWREQPSLNQCSIGIEFHIPNYANALNEENEGLNWYHFEALSSDQIIAGELLIKQLMEQYHIPSENIVFHSDISPWREDPITHQITLGKTDPGALFPAEYYASQGIGVWPKQTYVTGQAKDTSIHNAQMLLHEVGYHLKVTDQMDLETLYTIKAFKMHYMPQEYHSDTLSEEITPTMISLLENLRDKHYAYDVATSNVKMPPVAPLQHFEERGFLYHNLVGLIAEHTTDVT